MSATPEEQFKAEGKVSFPLGRDRMKELQSVIRHFEAKGLPKKLKILLGMVRFLPWKRMVMGQANSGDSVLLFYISYFDSIQNVEFLEKEDGGMSVVFSKEDPSVQPL